MHTKKQNIILVLKLLESESDYLNPLTQTKIARTISEVYPCDRKTVGRNIKFLISIGYPIIKTKQGFYLSKKSFSLEERKFILTAILESNEKSLQEKRLIADKLERILDKIYR